MIFFWFFWHIIKLFLIYISQQNLKMLSEQVGRIELPSPAWKAGVIAFIRHLLLIPF